MKIQNIGANNYKQKTNFGAVRAFTESLKPNHTILMSERSLIGFALEHDFLPKEEINNLMKIRDHKMWDVFGDSKDMKQLADSVETMNQAILSTIEKKVIAAKEKLAQIFSNIFNFAKTPEETTLLSNHKVEELIRAEDEVPGSSMIRKRIKS